MENKALIETLKTKVWDYLVSLESLKIELDVEGVKDTIFGYLSFGDIRKDTNKILEVVEVNNKTVLCSVRKHSILFDDELDTNTYLNMLANAIILKLVKYGMVDWQSATENMKLDGAAATILSKAGINTVGELVGDLQFASASELQAKLSDTFEYNTDNLYIGRMGAEANTKLSINAGITFHKPFITNNGKIYDFISKDIKEFIKFVQDNIRMQDNKFGIIKDDMNYFPLAVLDSDTVEYTDMYSNWHTDNLEHFSTVANKATLTVDYDSIGLNGVEKLQDKSFGIFKVKAVESIVSI
ncbi:hypothetical protein [Veillonella ratti]|uniref:hypothetical protein n=1 Tax=Veillonella ratti TaxID=103892 RepID=UPI000F8CC266|nr:hypothetical protein [Veillonella ratti]